MLSESPLMMAIDKGWLVEDVRIINLIAWALTGINWGIVWNERTFCKVGGLWKSIIRWNWFFIDRPLAYPLIVQSCDRYNVRPLPNFREFSIILRIWYPSSNSYSVISSRIQVSNNAPVSFPLIYLPELFHSSYFNPNAIFQNVLNLLCSKRELLTLFVDMFPLQFNRSRWAFCLGEGSFLKQLYYGVRLRKRKLCFVHQALT